MVNFFLWFFKSLSNAILLKMKKTSKKIEKKDRHQLLHKIWAKHDFSCFRKKVEKSHFFSFFETRKWCLTKNVGFVEKMWRIFFFNFLNRFLTSFCSKWKKLQKNSKILVPINVYVKFGQNTTFHIFRKKVEKIHFFSFFESQNRCLTKIPVLSGKYGEFFSYFF